MTINLNHHMRAAMSMVEVLFASAIVSGMVVASLDAAGMVFRARRLNADGTTGPAMAQELLEEVLAMPYEDPLAPGGGIGPENGETGSTRAAFDDVDDYHNWDSGDAKTKSGAAIDGFAGWRQQIRVVYVQPANPEQNLASDTGLKQVTVRVTSPAGTQYQMMGLRARYGAMEQKAGATIAPVVWLGAELQAGDATVIERRAARPSNHAAESN
jgi:hypothetical protein